MPFPIDAFPSPNLPAIPPTPSGPNPQGPAGFGRLYDRLQENSPPAMLPMRPIQPIVMPNLGMNQAWVVGMEGTVPPIGRDGLRQPSVGRNPQRDPVGPLAFLGPLADGIQQVNALQERASAFANEAAIGGDVDLHDVMIASEEAGVAMQVALQIRNKLVEAYQDINRMQV